MLLQSRIHGWHIAVLCAAAALAMSLISCRDNDNVAVQGSITPGPSPLPAIPAIEILDVGGDPASEIDGIDPCTLVRRSEVEDVLGDAVADVYRHSRPTVLCEFFTAAEGPFGSATVRVEHLDKAGELESERQLAELLGGAVQDVSGFGDEAFSVGPLLYIRQADWMILATVVVKEKPSLEAAKQVASLALARINSAR
ncbi:MAG TPA: hypothetical protein VLS25_00835 [Dehalococcoidia bacterium]|nr:hypothetical protein [Dehalococcoidia bacterium]